MKVLMSNHSDQNAGRSGVWYASARLNVQCFHNQQNIPNARRKKKRYSLCTSQRTGTADYLFVSRYSTEET